MNGINAVYMVESVAAVSRPTKIKKENKNSSHFSQKQTAESSMFADFLHSATQEAVEYSAEAPREFKNTVYGRNMKLSAAPYMTREYHY